MNAQATKQHGKRRIPPRPVPVHGLLAWQRGLVIATVVATVLLFVTSMGDVYVLPKFAVLAVLATVLVALVAWQALDERVVRLPRSPAVALAGAVVAVMALTSLIGGHRALSFVGDYGRNGGVLTYAAAFVLFWVVATRFDEPALRTLARAFVVVAAIFSAYAVLQVLGVEPFNVPKAAAGVLATLGQPNFVGAYVGILLPFALWVVVRNEEDPVWRLVAGLTVVGLVVVGLKSASFQTYLSLGAAAAVFLVVWASTVVDRRRLLSLVGAALVVVVLVGGALHSKIETQVRDGMSERVLLWQAAGKMVADRPVFGNGMSGYAARFAQERPDAHAVTYGTYQLSDAPHDVPLGLFVSGGVLLGGLYLAFVVLVGVQLVRAVRRSEGRRRLLVGAFGAAWVAYQFQSLVSIDVPTLIVGQFVLSGGVLVLAGLPERRTVALGAPPVRSRRAAVPTGVLVGRGVIVVATLVAVWLVVRPVRADFAFAKGQDLRASNDLPGAVAKFDSATSLAPWNGGYWAKLAGALAANGDQDRALVAGWRAFVESPSASSYGLSAAQLADRMGRTDLADHYFREVVKHAPNLTDALAANADFLLAHQRFTDAVPLLERALELRPISRQYVDALAIAYKGAGRPADARRMQERAKEVDPANGGQLLPPKRA